MAGLKVLMIDPIGSAAIAYYSKHLCNSLSKKDCLVTLITTRPYLFAGDSQLSYRFREEFLGMTEDRAYLKYKLAWAIDRLFRVCRTVQKCKKCIRTLQPDIVHVQYSYPLIDIFHLPGVQKNYPLIYTVHDIIGHHNQISFHPSVLKRFYNRLDHLILHTASNKKQLTQLFPIDQDKLTIIPHGISEPSPSFPDKLTSRRKLGFPENKFIILFFGTIRHNKGLDILIEAHSEVIRNHKKIFLVVAGKPHFRDTVAKYQHLIEKLNIQSHVACHLKFIPEKMVPYYFRAADIIALPYRYFSSQSGVLMQAYHYQRPVIATDVGGLAEAVREDKVGVVVAPSSSSSLAMAIKQMLVSKDKFPTYEANMLQAIHQKYNWDIIADKTLSFYQQLFAAFHKH